VFDLTCRDQLLDGASHVLNRHGRILPVLIEQVDAIGPKALERCLDDSS
jgi:hypothetical protein